MFLGGLDNVVMSMSIAEYNGLESSEYDSLMRSHPRFTRRSTEGFVSGVLEKDKYGSLKKFSVSETVKGITYYHFAIQAAFKYDSAKTKQFLDCQRERRIDIEYIGNEESFNVLTVDAILNEEFKDVDISGKIVVMGSLSPLDNDRFVTPLNVSDNGAPDMYGVVCISNMINQVLSFEGCGIKYPANVHKIKVYPK